MTAVLAMKLDERCGCLRDRLSAYSPYDRLGSKDRGVEIDLDESLQDKRRHRGHAVVPGNNGHTFGESERALVIEGGQEAYALGERNPERSVAEKISRVLKTESVIDLRACHCPIPETLLASGGSDSVGLSVEPSIEAVEKRRLPACVAHGKIGDVRDVCYYDRGWPCGPSFNGGVEIEKAGAVAGDQRAEMRSDLAFQRRQEAVKRWMFFGNGSFGNLARR